MDVEGIKTASIAILDDEIANVQLLQRILEPEGYENLTGFTHSLDLLEWCRKLPPDLILLDLQMPGQNGFEVIEELKGILPDFEHRAVIIVTSDGDRDNKRRALSGGARDFLVKPVSPVEVRLRVRNLLMTRCLHLELQLHNENLEQMVLARTSELNDARLEILDRLALAAEYRDDETGEHTRRVGRESARLAAALGLPVDYVARLERAAPLHDVGKIAVNDAILLKPGPLTEVEFLDMQRHTDIGAQLLSGSRFPLLQMAEEIALYHHENWDGSGYPFGLEGEDIPRSARIVALVDVFDSLTHVRPYKEAWSEEEALDHIEELIGKKFDPQMAKTFLQLRGRECTLDLSDIEQTLEASGLAAAAGKFESGGALE
jgi:putative two-component system response regulator